MMDPETKAKAMALVLESIRLMEAHKGLEGLDKLREASDVWNKRVRQ